ncbi:MAG: molybdopterin-guanine dinucleotide biosynthesis protein B [Proteobacteria bacterium]|jgi:molybdopterin-guanine dinucleotide biosynthesis protein B|nr:molybdopterin-guanine dinucleotide biosynthesis protein B [Pseudomonadota bacterium]
MRVFGFAGWSGSGKTTLIEALVPVLLGRGLSVSLVKHAHHAFDIDHPGKDSWRHRQAGCTEVLVSSAVRWALMHELRGAAEPSLDATIARLSPCDLVLVEGYKTAPIPKLEVWRPAVGKPRLHPIDPNIVALATDDPAVRAPGLTMFGLGDLGAIAAFVVERAQPAPPAAGGTAND